VRTVSVSFILYYYRLNAMATCINQLNDDCLELIFAACDGCPLTICTLGSVCKKWYSISHRHTVVSILFLWKIKSTPSKYILYSYYQVANTLHNKTFYAQKILSSTFSTRDARPTWGSSILDCIKAKRKSTCPFEITSHWKHDAHYSFVHIQSLSCRNRIPLLSNRKVQPINTPFHLLQRYRNLVWHKEIHLWNDSAAWKNRACTIPV
jgi:hypothetical protein